MELIDNNGVSKTTDGVSTIELGIAVPDDYWHCLMLPQDAKRKQRTEAIAILFAEIAQAASLNKPDANGTTESGIPIQYAHALRTIGRVVGYMINSSSWRDGVLQDFDKAELLKRVEHITFNR